ncbi:MAG TPA: ATP-dependent protease, partial [Thermoplasmatales archaeon]|nr:ATP-dependent protease [Thermoplasmatales archaeon]
MRVKVLIIIATILLSQIPILTNAIEEGQVHLFYRSVTVYAPAVAKTENGLVGTATIITVTVQNGTGCSGKVFVETVPLTEVDMQGSARLAVSVAGSLTGIDISDYDF